MDKIEVNLMGGQPGGQVLTILEGKANTPREPEKLTLTGDIRSVSTFIKNRKSIGHQQQIVLSDNTIVTTNKDAGIINLLTDPNNFYGTSVTGKLELSEALKAFRINEKGTMSQKDVVDILKFNKVHFRDRGQQEAMLRAYQAFTYKTQTDGKNESDARGNKANSIAKTVETNLPADFVLKIPIFKGEAVKEFRVEICLDLTDGSARFWFESVELHELIEIEKEIIFQRELQLCEGLVIIHK